MVSQQKKTYRKGQGDGRETLLPATPVQTGGRHSFSGLMAPTLQARLTRGLTASLQPGLAVFERSLKRGRPRPDEAVRPSPYAVTFEFLCDIRINRLRIRYVLVAF